MNQLVQVSITTSFAPKSCPFRASYSTAKCGGPAPVEASAQNKRMAPKPLLGTARKETADEIRYPVGRMALNPPGPTGIPPRLVQSKSGAGGRVVLHRALWPIGPAYARPDR